MKRFLLALLVGAFSACAYAQSTPVVASHLRMGGYDITSGTVSLVPVDSLGRPIPFADGTGAQNGPTAFECSITNGAIVGQIQDDGSVSGTCTVPSADQTTPQNLLYQVTVTDTSTGKRTSGTHYVLQSVAGIEGTSWALDHYGPPVQTTSVQLASTEILSAAPTGSCVSGQYALNRLTHQLYSCFPAPDGWKNVSTSQQPTYARQLVLFGDSITAGYNPLTSTQNTSVSIPEAGSYPQLLSSKYGYAPSDYAVGGYGAADVWREIVNNSYDPHFTDAAITTLMIGTNDAARSSADATYASDNYKTALDAIMAWVLTPAERKILPGDSRITSTAGTAPTVQTPQDQYSHSFGQVEELTVAGSAMRYTITDNGLGVGSSIDVIARRSDTVSGSCSVSVDGGAAQTFATHSATAINFDGAFHASDEPQLIHFGGLTGSSHTVDITDVSGTCDIVSVGWQAPASGTPANRPVLLVGDVPPEGPSATSGGYASSAQIANFNAVVASEIAKFAGYGYDVREVKTGAPYLDGSLTACYYPDEVHPLPYSAGASPGGNYPTSQTCGQYGLFTAFDSVMHATPSAQACVGQNVIPGSSGGTITIDPGYCLNTITTIGANVTLAVPAGKFAGQRTCFEPLENSTGGYTITLPNNILPSSGITFNTAAFGVNLKCMSWDASDSVWVVQQ